MSEVNNMLSPLTLIARKVLKRRRSLGFTQTRVAELVGCSQAYLAQVETGVRPISRRCALWDFVRYHVVPGL